MIRPDAALEIGRLEANPEKVQSIYDIGVSDGEKYLQTLAGWLKL